MSTSYRISVVIPTYQRCASVERALSALAHQTYPADQFEVIVSIDGSDDSTGVMAANFPAAFHRQVLWQPRRGRAAACNAGIRAAKGDLVILLDDDMEPAPEFLAAHQQTHLKASRVGVVGGAPIAFGPSSPPVLRYIGAKFNQHLEKLAMPGHQISFREFYSGNFSLSRALILQCGLFDERFKIYGNEDGELALRLINAGIKLSYCAAAMAHQHYEKNFAALARDNIAKGRTAVLLARKHPDTFQSLKLSTFQQGSRKWRLLRTGLLELSRLFPTLPKFVISSMGWLERYEPARLNDYYILALDYFYWLGARSALSEEPQVNHERTSWQERLEKPWFGQ